MAYSKSQVDRAGKFVADQIQMEDIGGVRAVFDDQEAAYRVARRLKANWTTSWHQSQGVIAQFISRIGTAEG